MNRLRCLITSCGESFLLRYFGGTAIAVNIAPKPADTNESQSEHPAAAPVPDL